jgi:hypothetical protein
MVSTVALNIANDGLDNGDSDQHCIITSYLNQILQSASVEKEIEFAYNC